MISRLTNSQLEYVIDELSVIKNNYCVDNQWELCDRMGRIVKKLEQQRKERNG